ncbi:MAG: hypothetical protein HQ593_04100 [Candidatus Omnitrophica bacterium]|nr:hypothetical protein [Candidatus Omnitrophota bacterium]
MLAKIMGTIWVMLGIMWLLKPEKLRARLGRKMSRKMRWITYGFAATFGFLLLGSIIKAPGMVAKIAGLVGMVITIKIVILLASKTSEKMIGWLSTKPLIFFRIWAAFIAATGLALFFG